MKNEILAFLNDPEQLEKMYRSNKVLFKKEFVLLYPEIIGNPVADTWNERLSYESDAISWGNGKELFVIIAASLLAGLIAKIPAIFALDEEFFYPRNIGFVLFPLLAAYFSWKNSLPKGKIAIIAGAMLAGLVFINSLPLPETDTLILSCIHLILFLWAVTGFAFVGGIRESNKRRLEYLKYNGDLVVMTTLILIAGGIMSAVTIGLFELIGFKIEEFYFSYFGIFGLAAAPIIATYLTQTNPQLVGKVSPVIAKIFSPLVLVMLLVFLGAMIMSGKDPYNDREFLIIFNALLVGVMAIIFFSVAGTLKGTKSRAEIWILLLLSVITIVVNSIALSAILFRISEWGITPNRAAVLGANILILINLIMVTAHLYKFLAKKTDPEDIGNAIARYLPVYVIWTVIVTFIFPLIF
ncbi:MAG: hypothetical protein PHV09_05350 [Bacteroidales bacterium]|jgi:hypothetical protein|nr:hypothetical protein [Bacteroidales bacterium]MDD2280713.1 hypothetical protein [Bacteroidales bacterium]MDD4292966.1 hypothetical protein [Bacteroidales bacterium]MDD4491933.1 hypothetical protein [Bacteroidales bacterium]HNW48440.1 hypothetical protein [Bacteroidales bacterium]